MKDSKTLVIGMLCAVVCIMAVAYAAFSTTLNINGTASIESSWGVKLVDGPSCTFKAVNASSATTATACTGSEQAGDNTMCASAKKESDSLATITMRFKSPGDTATCTVSINNYGTLNAKLTHKVNGQAYSATVADTDAIDFEVSGLDTALAAGATKTITIIGRYKDVTSQPSSTSATLTLVTTAEQDL